MRGGAAHSAAKRALDLAGASLGLLTASPLLLVLIPAVRLSLGRPVFFRQERTGYHGQVFTMYKLRTMTDARDAQGRLLPDAVRLTRFGRWLRATSLDELPELWNVLRGEMSLVGPRPLLPAYLSRYTSEQRRRHDVKPGLTGWAQVHGRNALMWEEKFALDVWYVDHQSFLLDVKIILMTLRSILAREGVSHPGHVTAPEFMGVKAEGSAVGEA